MKISRYLPCLPACVGVLVLAACAPPADPPANAASGASAPSSGLVATASAPTAANSLLVRAIYTWGPEVETISPCNTDKVYWLDGNETQLAPLQDIALKKADQANEAYQPVYVEVRVSDAGKATDGFAVDYDGVMHLEAVAQASSDIPSDCKLEEAAPQPGASASRP